MNNFRVEPMKQCTLFLLLFLCGGALAQRAVVQVVVIANLGVKATDVSSADLRDVFAGASSSLQDGAHVTPVLLKPGPVNDEFLNLYIGKSDAAFRTTWRSLLFSGQGVMPRSFDSEAALVDYVAHTPGAIGYVAKATPHEGVKVLSVR
jgi:ABC-type phosphate transport system substrate-binding protein